MEQLKYSVVGLSSGVVFGMAFEKAQIVIPNLIKAQMLFENNTMLKVFLSATATGTLVFGLLELLKLRKKQPRAPVALGLDLFNGYDGNVFGGLALGVGVTLSGSCPGTVFAQLGAGIPSAFPTFIGCILGASLYGYFNPVWARKSNHGKKGTVTTVNKYLGEPAATLVIATLCAGVAYAFEHYFPYAKDLQSVGITDNVPPFSWDPRARAWSPWVAGISIGLLQLFTKLFTDNSLGCSSSYLTLVGPIFRLCDIEFKKNGTYFLPYIELNPSNFFFVALTTGIALGAYLSRHLSGGSQILQFNGVDTYRAFLGGICLLMGARTANGCTSGHGISGIAQGSIASIVTICSMFAGSIATAFLLRK